MKQVTKTIQIPEGVIPNHVMDDVRDILAQFQGKTIELTFEIKRKKRSNPQNAFWWGVVIPMVKNGIEEHGTKLTAEQTHDLLKQKFLAYQIPIDQDGNTETIFKNTSGLDTFEFNQLIEQTQRWSAEWLGIIIPDPNEQLTFEQQ